MVSRAEGGWMIMATSAGVLIAMMAALAGSELGFPAHPLRSSLIVVMIVAIGAMGYARTSTNTEARAEEP